MRPLAELAIVIGAGLAASSAAAQTIADYSRAQRALLEAAMAQAAARSAALGAAGTAPSASQASAPTARVEAPVPAPVEAVVAVDGVFDSRDRTLAEVSVDGRLFLLSTGEAVPGTAWRVAAIAADRVVLVRRAPGAPTRGGRTVGISKIFALPALR